MTTPLYSKKQIESFYYIKNGSAIYHITQGIPLLIWIIFIITGNALTDKKHKLINLKQPFRLYHLIILIPFLIYIYNIYTYLNAPNPLKKVDDSSAITMQHGWGYCFNSEVTKDEHNRGILAKLNQKCINNNQQLVKQNVKDLITRFYYLNYIILLLFIGPRQLKYINTRYSKTQCHVIGFALLFGVLATIVPLFSTYIIRGLWIVQTLSIMLVMNISCFMIIMITFLADIL